MSVTDDDSGDNGRVSCFVDHNDVFILQDLYPPAEFKLVTVVRLDREQTSVYVVTIRCRDHASSSPAMTSSATLRVRVGDENDNRPRYPVPFYAAEVRENGAVGAELLRVRATDADAGENALIVYRLGSAGDGGVLLAADLVAVDAQTGVVRVRRPLDREAIGNEFEFSVVAEDGARPPTARRSSCVRVVVTVSDVDDESPELGAERYVFAVRENRPAGTVVGTVEARDGDLPPFDRFTFTVHETSNGGRREIDDTRQLFDIDQVSGQIVTRSPLVLLS